MNKFRLMGTINACVFACLFVCLNQANAATINDFTGGYAVGNWTQVPDGGSIDTTGAPNSVELEGADDEIFGGATSTDLTIAALGSGTVSFDWSYSTTDGDPINDPFGWLLNGTFTKLTLNGALGGLLTQIGTTSFAVVTGDIFGFSQRSTDSYLGSATTIVSNFSAPGPVPVPAALWLFGSGLLGLVGMARRKKAA